MADSKLSALTSAGAFADADLLYIVQGGTSYKTTWGAVKAAILLAKYPEVANFAALPAAGDHDTETYVCLASQGTYFINRKPAGFYYSNGSAWSHVGDLPEDYFTDSILQISDDADPTKICKFQLSSITAGQTRTLTVPDASGTIMLVGNAPATHATSHKSGGGDAIKLDELAATTDVTTLDASTTAHGLLVKATAPASGLINVVAIGNGETAYTNKALLDSTNPAALGSVSPGTATVAARRDHVHAMPTAADVGAATTSTKLDDFGTPDDNTDLNASTSRHGLLLKATAPASGLVSFVGIANGETAYTNKALLDSTNPAALGSVGPGTATVAARRDHVHAMPTAADVGAATTSTKLDDFAATDDNTDLDATTSKHGLMPKTDKIKLDAGKRTFIAALGTDDTYSGDDVSLTAAETTAQWDVGYVNSSSKIALADADAASTALGIYLATAAISTDAAGVYLESGYARNDAWSWTPGGALYLSTTPGGITQTQPSGTDDAIVVLGVAITADIIRFKPSLIYITHT